MFIRQHLNPLSTQASFNVESFPASGPLFDHAVKASNYHESYVEHNCRQEVLMFDNFSSCLLQENGEKIITGSGVDASHWMTIAAQTQSVMDACMKSMHAGGIEIDIEY